LPAGGVANRFKMLTYWRVRSAFEPTRAWLNTMLFFN